MTIYHTSCFSFINYFYIASLYVLPLGRQCGLWVLYGCNKKYLARTDIKNIEIIGIYEMDVVKNISWLDFY